MNLEGNEMIWNDFQIIENDQLSTILKRDKE